MENAPSVTSPEKKTQSTGSDRASFFGDVSVDVGGDVLSFDDLEHGILRGNARHPYQVARRFDTPTGRRLGLTRLDHRVHFALNCGATSCPPVKRYTPEAIDEELRLAAMAFCEADDNVRIDEGERRVHLSKLLYWYQSDFGACDAFCLTSYTRGFEKSCRRLVGTYRAIHGWCIPSSFFL
jgi:hypothetical protein